MTEALNRSGPVSLELIHLDDPRELAYWTHVLGVSEHELEAIVAKVGPRAVDVRRHVSRARHTESHRTAHQAPQPLQPETQRSGGDSSVLLIASCAVAVLATFGTLAYKLPSTDRTTVLRQRNACEAMSGSSTAIEQLRCAERRSKAVRTRFADAADSSTKPMP